MLSVVYIQSASMYNYLTRTLVLSFFFVYENIFCQLHAEYVVFRSASELPIMLAGCCCFGDAGCASVLWPLSPIALLDRGRVNSVSHFTLYVPPVAARQTVGL